MQPNQNLKGNMDSKFGGEWRGVTDHHKVIEMQYLPDSKPWQHRSSNKITTDLSQRPVRTNHLSKCAAFTSLEIFIYFPPLPISF